MEKDDRGSLETAGATREESELVKWELVTEVLQDPGALRA